MLVSSKATTFEKVEKSFSFLINFFCFAICNIIESFRIVEGRCFSNTSLGVKALILHISSPEVLKGSPYIKIFDAPCQSRTLANQILDFAAIESYPKIGHLS